MRRKADTNADAARGRLDAYDDARKDLDACKERGDRLERSVAENRVLLDAVRQGLAECEFKHLAAQETCAELLSRERESNERMVAMGERVDTALAEIKAVRASMRPLGMEE